MALNTRCAGSRASSALHDILPRAAAASTAPNAG